MPRRDEEKRIAFLRTLSVEDLANRRITEFSSESEKQMIHQARDAMKEKNDVRWMRRYKKKAAVDTVKTQMGVVGRRAQNEVFGREGGLTGGMVGSWLLGGTLAGGTIIGIASRGKFGAMAKTAGKFKGGTRAKIADLQELYKKGIITDKHADKVAKLVTKHKSGQAKNFDYDQLDWFHNRYKERAKILFPRKGGNPKTPSASPVKTKRALTEEERQIIREHRQKIRGGTTAGKKTADNKPQTVAEVLPPPPVDPKEIFGDALGKLQTARGGKVSLKIERGNTDAFDQLAKDIASVADQYPDAEQQYKIAQMLAQKAARQNVPPGNKQKLDDYIQELYGKVIDVKKK